MLQKNALRWLTAQGSNSVWFVRTRSYGTYGTCQAPLGFMNCSLLAFSCLELHMEWQVPIMMIKDEKICRIKSRKILWMMPHFQLLHAALFLICAKLPYECRLGDEKAYLSNWTDSKGKCLLYYIKYRRPYSNQGFQLWLQTFKKGAILALKFEKIHAYHPFQNVKTSDSSRLHLTLVLRVLFILSFCLLLSWFSSICLTDKMTCSFFLFVKLQALFSFTGFLSVLPTMLIEK